MSFRLWTIFYVFALVAASLATFGAWGVLLVAIVLLFWAAVFYLPKRTITFTFANSLIAILIFVLLLGLMLPAVQSARESARRSTCMSQLRQIALALLNYESQYKSLPPAFAADANGAPLYGWRVLILPFAEHDVLFRRLDLSKAWDSPTNQLLRTPIDLLECPSHFSPDSNNTYFAVVGPNTAWPGAVGRRMSEIQDGAANTLLLIESHRTPAEWAEPRDLTFDEAVDLLTRPAGERDGHRIDEGFFYKPSFSRNVVFADGHVDIWRGPLSREVAVALLTVDGGEEIPIDFARNTNPELDYAKCYVFGLFVALALLPAAWIRGHRVKAQATASIKATGADAAP